MKLTEAQTRELQAVRGPVRVTGPGTSTEYVILPAEIYDRVVRTLLDDSDFDPDEALPLVNEMMAEYDAGDPLLESYQTIQEGFMKLRSG